MYLLGYFVINSLNVDKTQYMIIAGKKKFDDCDIKIYNKKIQMSRSIKYLGVHIDDRLT